MWLNQALLHPSGMASGAIEEIYKRLSRNKQKIKSFGLANGFLGLCLFYYLYGRHAGKNSCLAESAVLFDQALEMINTKPINYPLHFTDLGVVCRYLSDCGVLGYDPNHFLQEVDLFLLGRMRRGIQQMDFGGFADGAVSHGLYFLDRAQSDPQRFIPVVRELVTALLGCCVTTRQSAHWYPDQTFRMPLWNGQAAVILFLVAATEHGFVEEHIMDPILGKAIQFLSFQFKTHSPASSLLSFQLGELGIGYALLRAGQVFENHEWYEMALDLLGKCAGCCLANAGMMKSAGILIGAAGAAHTFDKVHGLTGTPVFGAAADLCFARLLPLYSKGCAEGTLQDTASGLCFGTGLAGIGTALIKSLHRSDHSYDHLLWLI